jgi:hypothetical protein
MTASLPQSWQEINDQWHICHWWQDHGRRMITAMTLIFLLLIAAVAAVAGTMHTIAHDNRGATPPPPSHLIDPGSLPPSARLTYRI